MPPFRVKAEDALFRSRGSNDGSSQDRDEPEPRQRRADALALLAERSFAAGFDTDAPISGSKAERYQVMLHVEADTLTDDREPGQSELTDGTRVSAETSRRIACDAGIVRVAHAPDGSLLDVERRTRTIPPSVRRALEARDRGCRFPGCGLRFTDAHHVKHWADGGENNLRNLVLLCRRHHRAVHEGGFSVCLDRAGQVAFFAPRGKAIFDAPEEFPRKHFELSRPLDEEARAHRPSHVNGAARWVSDADVPWEVEARAWEALEAGAG